MAVIQQTSYPALALKHNQQKHKEAQGRTWPTTGFPAASFRLLTRELDQTNDYYTFSVTKGGEALSVFDGNEFTYRADLYGATDLAVGRKPPVDYTIKVKNKKTNQEYEYSFTIDYWGKPDSVRIWYWTEAIDNCRNIGGELFSINEYTNSDSNNGPKARFKRAIDGTLQGEWGSLHDYNQKGAVWKMDWNPSSNAYDGYYWTSDFTQVFVNDGSHWSWRYPNAKFWQACKVPSR